MITEYLANTWAEFEDAILEITKEYGIYMNRVLNLELPNGILYRGQGDYNWGLDSTLERYSGLQWNVEDYVNLALRCAPQIKSFTKEKWDLLSPSDLESEMRKNPHGVPCLPFLTYLRHHGFPSPLLDWTDYPYIAAFFALREQNAAVNAGVFVYVGAPKRIKTFWGENDPWISTVGEKMPTPEKRHFLQRSRYTICRQINEGQKYPFFVPHEEVFKKGSTRQDILIKIVIPRTRRLDFLSRLDDELGINDFSLFISEEALMKTLAFKEIEQS